MTPQTIRRAKREIVVGGKFLNRSRATEGEKALMKAPRQYEYRPLVPNLQSHPRTSDKTVAFAVCSPVAQSLSEFRVLPAGGAD